MNSVVQDEIAVEDFVGDLKRKQESLLQEKIPVTVSAKKTLRLSGEIAAPPSKSYSHRAIMVAGMCTRSITVQNPLLSEDIIATARAWWALGARMRYIAGENAIVVHGVERPFLNAQSLPEKIYVTESGTTLRFVLPGLAFAKGSVRVEGKQSLRTRPNTSVVEALRKLGVKVEAMSPGDTIPITVSGTGVLPTGDITIPGGLSSQVVSAFLFWMALASPARKNTLSRIFSSNRENVSVIQVEGELVSRPYVDITIDVLHWAGIKVESDSSRNVYRIAGDQKFSPQSSVFTVNGDYSSAAFVLAAASIINSDVTVHGLKVDKQGDRAIVDILKRMGSNVDDSVPGRIRVKGSSELRGLNLDCSDTPDLVPILCVLGAFAEGTTTLTNISHLKYKETDRLKAPTEELRKLGVRIEHTSDSITIRKSQLVANKVCARGDHRLAMSLMVAGLAGAGSEVQEAPSIRKSYPLFIRDMRALGAELSG